MAVKLRLRRIGRKKRAIYRIVAADARSPRDGRFIEEIGFYNPLTNPASVDVKEDRALYWLQNGAMPTDTVKSIFRKKGIILRFDLMRRGLSEEQMAEEIKKWEILQIERAKKQEVLAKQAEKEVKKRVKAAPAEQEAPEKPAEAPAPESPEKTAEAAAPESSEEKAETAAPEAENAEKKSEETAEASAKDQPAAEADAAPEKTDEAAEAEKSE